MTIIDFAKNYYGINLNNMITTDEWDDLKEKCGIKEWDCCLSDRDCVLDARTPVAVVEFCGAERYRFCEIPNERVQIKINFEDGDFLDDYEKMDDMEIMSKEEFLESYSYLTEKEYDNTVIKYFRRLLDEEQMPEDYISVETGKNGIIVKTNGTIFSDYLTFSQAKIQVICLIEGYKIRSSRESEIENTRSYYARMFNNWIANTGSPDEVVGYLITKSGDNAPYLYETMIGGCPKNERETKITNILEGLK